MYIILAIIQLLYSNYAIPLLQEINLPMQGKVLWLSTVFNPRGLTVKLHSSVRLEEQESQDYESTQTHLSLNF